jgi:hypothetical protein
MPSYALEYYDDRYPADLQAKLNDRTSNGWKIQTATIAYPYLHVLWEREGEPQDPALKGRDLPQDTASPTPNDPAGPEYAPGPRA